MSFQLSLFKRARRRKKKLIFMNDLWMESYCFLKSCKVGKWNNGTIGCSLFMIKVKAWYCNFITLTIIFSFSFFHSQNIYSIEYRFASITLREPILPWSGSLSSFLKCIIPPPACCWWLKSTKESWSFLCIIQPHFITTPLHRSSLASVKACTLFSSQPQCLFQPL